MISQSITWSGATAYYISWVSDGNAEPPQPPTDGAPVPSKPLSPMPTLPDAAATAESDL